VAELDGRPVDAAVTVALDEAACTVLHVDMDAFFAAVEVLDDPSLAGRPVIVGGAGARGVVASCTYEARAYGIRSAMPSVEARHRCPQALFLAGRYARYAEMSERLFAVLTSFTPAVEGVGLDEAFLDVAGARRLLGHPVEIAHAIRAKVRDDLALGCSVGVARSKMLAKLASRAAKPIASRQGTKPGHGVVVVAPTEELAFLHPMPIRALWGVGPATARRLEGLGVATVGDLARVPGDALRRAIGVANGRQLAALARGEDPRGVVARRPVKSVGHEQTFAVDYDDRADLHPHLVRMADAVGARLHESGQRGRTITLKVRFADRRTITRSHTVNAAMDSPRALALIAGALLDGVDVGPGVRLIGVSVSGLDADHGAGEQLRFGETEATEPPAPGGEPAEPGRARRDQAWHEVDAALGAIRARYGQSSVGPATLVGPRGLAVKRRGDTQWGPGSDAETTLPATAAAPRED
jgi:DNA polymerase-4